MAAVSLLWNTNMAAVTSCENTILKVIKTKYAYPGSLDFLRDVLGTSSFVPVCWWKVNDFFLYKIKTECAMSALLTTQLLQISVYKWQQA